MVSEVTIEEWLAELERAEKESRNAGGDGMLSAREICDLTGKSIDFVRLNILQPAHKRGRLITKMGRRLAISGQMKGVPVYQIVPAAKAKKKK